MMNVLQWLTSLRRCRSALVALSVFTSLVAVDGFGCDTAVTAENYQYMYRYFWAEVGTETQNQGLIVPNVSSTCVSQVPCTAGHMYPGGTAHAYGWIAPMLVDGRNTSMYFTYGGEGVGEAGIANVLLHDLWGFSNGQWYIFGGQNMPGSWPNARSGTAAWFNDSPDTPATYVFGGWSDSTSVGTQCNKADMWVINTTTASFDSRTGTGTPATATKLSPETVGGCDFQGSPSWPSARTEASTWKSREGNDTLLWLAFGRRAGPNLFVLTAEAFNDVWYV